MNPDYAYSTLYRILEIIICGVSWGRVGTGEANCFFYIALLQFAWKVWTSKSKDGFKRNGQHERLCAWLWRWSTTKSHNKLWQAALPLSSRITSSEISMEVRYFCKPFEPCQVWLQDAPCFSWLWWFALFPVHTDSKKSYNDSTSDHFSQRTTKVHTSAITRATAPSFSSSLVAVNLLDNMRQGHDKEVAIQ